VKFDPAAGDLNATAANSGIGVVKNLAITNAKLANLSAVSQLKGSSASSVAATDISLGTGLCMTGSTLSVDASTIGDATASTKGVVQLGGDLNGPGSIAAAPIISNQAVTYVKMQQAAPSTLLGTASTNANPGNYGAITLGPSMSMTTSTLNSGVSFLPGPDPNILAPTDRPANINIAYIGINGSLWLWNGTTYIQQTFGLPTIGAWVSSPITIGSTGTVPTKGTVITDYIRYRQKNSKEYDIEMYYRQSSTGTAGTGYYLFSLPTGLTFDPSLYSYSTLSTFSPYNILISMKSVKQYIGFVSIYDGSTEYVKQVYIAPYNSTQFRLYGYFGVTTSPGFIPQGFGLNFNDVIYTNSFTLQIP